MRIRSTKPEFWKSKTIADALEWSDRFVLKGLEAYVDDNGVGKDDIELIATEVFPRDTFRSPRETVARLSEAISRIHQAGLIARYEVDGENLLYVDKWKDLQRIDKPSKGRFPRPDGTFEYIQPVNRETYRSPREESRRAPETLAPGTGEQGNRGTGEQGKGSRGAGDDEVPLPLEPPPGPYDPQPTDVVIETPPSSIETPHRPAKRYPSSSAKTVVRQVLGSAGYPRTTLERLASQVENLARDGHPDTLIRQAITEWDRRSNCDRPEYLPTVLGDLVKNTRARPDVSAHDEKVNGFLAYANPSTQKEIS